MSITCTSLHCGAFYDERQIQVEVTEDGNIRAFKNVKGGLCWLPGNHEGPHDWEYLPITRVEETHKWNIVKPT